LTTEIEKLGYLEEALIERARANGESIERRTSAPPAAVLQVKVVEAVQTRAARMPPA
jgi:hypothetical protein